MPETKRVLIVEDQFHITKDLVEDLTSKCKELSIPIVIDHRACLNSALRLTDGVRYDVMSTDMQYPRIDGGSIMQFSGLEFIMTTGLQGILSPIILYTGAPKDEVHAKASEYKIEHGRFAYVSKPYDDVWLQEMMKVLTQE